MKVEPVLFLLVEDSEHDILAFRRAWEENGIRNELRIVRDGRECLDYLFHRGRYSVPETAPRPNVVLLNNRMPRMEGLTVLEHIRQNPSFEYMPVVIFTATVSDLKESQSYDRGANAYIGKPMEYETFSRVVSRVNDFWELVEVPET